MKSKFMSKASAALICGSLLLAAIPASATTYYSDQFHGTSEEGDNVYLGDGTRYIYGSGNSGSAGKGRAMRIIPSSPDEIVGQVNILGTRYRQDDFEAVAAYDYGEDESVVEQQYYIKWMGNSSSHRATLSLSD